jgi:hypothetical protein
MARRVGLELINAAYSRFSFVQASDLFQQSPRPVWDFVGGIKHVSLAHLENRSGLGTRVIEDQCLMHDLQYVTGIREAPSVSSTYVRIGHIVPALGHALPDSLDAPLRIIQANIEESGEEGSFQRCFYRSIGPIACQGGFDSEALRGSKVLRGAAKNLLSG